MNSAKTNVSESRVLRAIAVGFLFMAMLPARGQLNIGADTTICLGQSITLTASYGVPGNNFDFNSLQQIPLIDDQYSGVIDLGFSFSFYGTPYTQCLLSSNNYITFDLTKAGLFSEWEFDVPIPNASLPTNAIMCPYQDINPGAGGVIEYGTIGTAPNRIFVVRYLSVPMFLCNANKFCSAVLLYEGSNRIETHLENKMLCSNSNTITPAIHGTHNDSGTRADVVSGRNYPEQWEASMDAWEWVPNGPNSYTINSIPFLRIISNNNAFDWREVSNNTIIGTGNSITVAPTTTTTYWTEVAALCGGTGNSGNYDLIDHITITVVPASSATVTHTNPICTQNASGTVSVTPNSGSPPWRYDITDAGGGVLHTMTSTGPGPDVITNVVAGTYQVVVTDSFGCSTQSQVVINGNSPVVVTPSTDTLICLGGTATIDAVASGGSGTPYDFSWNQSLIGNGPHAVSPVANAWYRVQATDQDGCASAYDSVYVALHPGITALIQSPDSICPGDSSVLTVAAVGGDGSDFMYSWSDGTSAIGSDSSVVVYPWDDHTVQYCATVHNGCEASPAMVCTTVPIYELPSVTFVSDTNEVCLFPGLIHFQNTTNVPVSSVTWDFGDGTIVHETSPFAEHTYHTAGSFDVNLSITTVEGCVVNGDLPKLIRVRSHPDAYFEATPPSTDIFETKIDFHNGSVGNVSNLWDFNGLGTSEEMHPTFEFAPGISAHYQVKLTVWDAFNCSDSYLDEVVVENGLLVYAPNAFTPNGDGLNDFFYVAAENVSDHAFEFYVFDRQGHIIWRTVNKKDAWNGLVNDFEKAPSGVYTWKIRARTQKENKRFEKIGYVTVIR